MGNWQQKIRENLRASNLPRAIQDEVVAELALHLEKAYADARASGVCDHSASNVVLRQVGRLAGFSPEPSACKIGGGSREPSHQESVAAGTPDVAGSERLLGSIAILRPSPTPLSGWEMRIYRSIGLGSPFYPSLGLWEHASPDVHTGLGAAGGRGVTRSGNAGGDGFDPALGPGN